MIYGYINDGYHYNYNNYCKLVQHYNNLVGKCAGVILGVPYVATISDLHAFEILKYNGGPGAGGDDGEWTNYHLARDTNHEYHDEFSNTVAIGSGFSSGDTSDAEMIYIRHNGAIKYATLQDAIDNVTTDPVLQTMRQGLKELIPGMPL